MLKKTIKFTDLDGKPAEEDAYFNLTKAEAIELNIRNDLEVIGRSKNNNDIMDTFKRIISMSYGVRTGDGKFIKEPRDFAVFSAGEAYSELFMEIWQDPDYALEFIKSILPAGIMDQEQTQAASVPPSMADHPSMQGHKKPQAKAVIPEEPKPNPAQTYAEMGSEDPNNYPPVYQAPIVPTKPEPESYDPGTLRRGSEEEYQRFLAWQKTLGEEDNTELPSRDQLN